MAIRPLLNFLASLLEPCTLLAIANCTNDTFDPGDAYRATMQYGAMDRTSEVRF